MFMAPLSYVKYMAIVEATKITTEAVFVDASSLHVSFIFDTLISYAMTPVKKYQNNSWNVATFLIYRAAIKAASPAIETLVKLTFLCNKIHTTGRDK